MNVKQLMEKLNKLVALKPDSVIQCPYDNYSNYGVTAKNMMELLNSLPDKYHDYMISFDKNDDTGVVRMIIEGNNANSDGGENKAYILAEFFRHEPRILTQADIVPFFKIPKN